MQIFRGVPAASGIAIGKGFNYQATSIIPERKTITDIAQELLRLEQALQQAERELEAIYQETKERVGEETAEIFSAHLMILKDPDLKKSVIEMVEVEQINVDAAFYEASEVYAEMLENLADEYLQARAADIRDVSSRVISALSDEISAQPELSYPAIVFAEDLAPSDTVQFKREHLLGFFTEKGGATSHTAILSKALGIPAVVGAGELPASLKKNTVLILDGNTGELIVDPDELTLKQYVEAQEKERQHQEEERQAAGAPAVTRDGKQVEVVANIGNLEDAVNAVRNGAEGVGLFRTEFSFLEQASTPNEEELVEVYREIFDVFGDMPVVVRTLDIGGDKEVPHLELPTEENAFLGHRGIRLCLSRPDLFKPQLRAVLRAGVDSNLHIMLPMIATVDEIRQSRRMLEECMAELQEEGADYNAAPQIGVMIEVPSAVVCADQMAKEVDFFSIGTNDLTQYTMAADRTNPNVSYLISGLQPAVLRLIRQVIDHGHAAGIWVGMCGELAGEPLAIPILLGLGLDEFSMNPPAIPQAKEIIRQWELPQAAVLAEQVLQCETPEEIKSLVAGWKSSQD